MRKHFPPKAQAIWGALAGFFLAAIVLVMAGLISFGAVPRMLEEQLDPVFLGHSLLALLLLGAIAGAIMSALSAKSRPPKK